MESEEDENLEEKQEEKKEVRVGQKLRQIVNEGLPSQLPKQSNAVGALEIEMDIEEESQRKVIQERE